MYILVVAIKGTFILISIMMTKMVERCVFSRIDYYYIYHYHGEKFL